MFRKNKIIERKPGFLTIMPIVFQSEMINDSETANENVAPQFGPKRPK